jgi:PmbA protein
MMDILKYLQVHAEQVEVMDLLNESTKVSFDANKLKSSKVEETRGTAVRVIKNGHLGFSASSDPSAVDKLVVNALESANYGDTIPLVFPGPEPAPQVITFDPKVTELPIPRLVEIGQEIIDYIRQIEPEARLTVELERGVQQMFIRNQAGTDIACKRSPLSILAEISVVKGDDILITFEVSGTTTWQADYMEPFRRLGEKLKRAHEITTVKSGHMPVLFAPAGVLVLGIPLMEGINGKNVYTGISPLAGKLSKKLFDSKITIVDDPTIDGKFGSAAFDDEGVAHRRNVIFEQGVLKTFLYDLKTAALSGAVSTGNGARGLFNQPRPSPTNLLIEPGETPLTDILAGIDEGLWIENVLGLGQGIFQSTQPGLQDRKRPDRRAGEEYLHCWQCLRFTPACRGSQP